MTRRALRRLLDVHVAPAFPELTAWGDELVRWDGDPVLRGFSFDRFDASSDGFRVRAFAQPLFIPAETVILAVAAHLCDVFLAVGPEAELMADVRERAERDGRAFLSRTSTCSALAENVLALRGDGMGEALALEMRGGCLAWTGDDAEADAALERAAQELKGAPTGWEADALVRVEELRKALARSPAAALELLDTRARETRRALGLAAA